MRADEEWAEGVKAIYHVRGPTQQSMHKARNTNMAGHTVPFFPCVSSPKDKEFMYVCVIAATVYSSRS